MWICANGPVVFAAVAALVFIVVHPAVPDLQAAEARAVAAAHGVGVGYWLSWFSGSAPGDYSVLTPQLSAALGATVTAALATVGICVLGKAVLAGAPHARSGSYVLTAAAVGNLYSGRVAFSVGCACALLSLVQFRRGRGLRAGFINAAAALASPLAAAFLLLGLLAPALTTPSWRQRYVALFIPSVCGLLVPAVAFGVPGRMPFATSTMLCSLTILIAAAALHRYLPLSVRIGLHLAILATVGAYVLPTGVGANMQRYAFLVVPPLVWAFTTSRRRLTALALVPAFAYSGFNTVTDLAAASTLAAQHTYYTGLHTALRSQRGLLDHRVEVIDTPTHRADRELAPDVFLARGWESQDDTADNPIFYDSGALTAASYRRWLDINAVAWVAVPDQPDSQSANEVNLIDQLPNYLHPIWHNQHWRLFTVTHPSPIVSAPGRLIAATPTSMTIRMSTPGTLTLQIHPSKYLTLIRLRGDRSAPTTVCLEPSGTNSEQARNLVAGQYKLDVDVTLDRALTGQPC